MVKKIYQGDRVTQVNAVLQGSSTTLLLTAGAFFTGDIIDVTDIISIQTSVLVDQTATLYVEFSSDATNFDDSQTFAVVASTLNKQTVKTTAQYLRVRLENTSGSTFTVNRTQVIAGNRSVSSATTGTTDVNLGEVGGVAIDLGKEASAGSIPTVLSNEQETILTDIDTVLDNIKVDTEAIETAIELIEPKIPALGQTNEAGSSPVTLTTLQDGKLTDIETATQSTATNTEAVSDRLPASLGSKTSAASLSVTIANDEPTIPVSGTVTATGPLTNAELRFSDVGVAVAGLLGDGHNVKVDNLDSDGIPIINQTGDTLSVGGAVTVTSGTVTANIGTNNVQGEISTGAAVSGTKPFIIAGSTSGNAAIPSVVSSGSFNIWGTAILNSTGQIAGVSNGSLMITGDEAHNDADAGSPLKIGTKAIDFNTSGFPTDVAAADRVNGIGLQDGRIIHTNMVNKKRVALSSLNTTWNITATESNNSGDIDTVGFTRATLCFNLDSTGSPADFQWTLEVKDSTNYYQLQNSFWSFFYYEDAQVSGNPGFAVEFKIPSGAETIRIVGDATGLSSGVDEFDVTNAVILMES